MSQTYLASIAQFAVVLGLINQTEADTFAEGIIAVIALANLLWALWGRWRAGGITFGGLRK